MADQQRWFKLWASVLTDDELQSLPPADRWAWAALGAHIKQSGTRGSITISLSNAALAAALGVTCFTLLETLKRLPHVRVTPFESDNGRVTVTYLNWSKYQVDSTVAQRVARLRSKKRGEERRKEPPQAPQKGASQSEPWTSPNGLGSDEDELEGAEALGGAAAEQLDEVPDELRDALTLLEFLNLRTGRTFAATLATLHLIDARLREGWSVQDCKTMVMRKINDWRGDERMAQYLRPATLFNRAKLEGYMGALGFTRS